MQATHRSYSAREMYWFVRSTGLPILLGTLWLWLNEYGVDERKDHIGRETTGNVGWCSPAVSATTTHDRKVTPMQSLLSEFGMKGLETGRQGSIDRGLGAAALSAVGNKHFAVLCGHSRVPAWGTLPST